MLNLSDIKTGKNILLDDQPYVVISHEHSKTGRAGAVLRTKLRNLITGGAFEKTFQGSDKVYDADISKTKAQFLYTDDTNFYFMDLTSYDQFSLPKDVLGDATLYLVPDTEVTILQFNSTPINVEIPIKVTLEVIEAPPGIRGDTSSSGDKVVTLETGMTLTTPLFVKVGDKIIVNTERGIYTGRA